MDESHFSDVGDDGDFCGGGGVESCGPIDDEGFADEVVSGDNSGAEFLAIVSKAFPTNSSFHHWRCTPSRRGPQST